MAQQAIWGLDASPTSIKGVKLTGSPESPVFQRTDGVDLNVVSPDDDDEVGEQVGRGLQEFAERNPGVRSQKVVASLPSHTTFNRLIKLPPVEEERVEEIVQYEAQQHIPFSLDEVIWDHQQIERDYGPGDEREVVLFAIKKNIVHDYINQLERAGIDPDVVQFSPVALFNFVQFDQPVDRTTAIIDIGANNCDLIIIEGKKYWVRNVPMAANDITRALAAELDVSFEKADQIKKNIAGSDRREKLLKVMQPVYRELVQEIHRSIGFYKSMSEGSQIEQILLAGGGARTYKLREFIGENMQMDARMISSMNRVQAGPQMDPSVLQNRAHSLAPAVGLALQGMGVTRNRINLMPPELLKKKEIQQKKPYVLASGAFLTLGVLLYAISGYIAYSSYDSTDLTAYDLLVETEEINESVQEARNHERLERQLAILEEQSYGPRHHRRLPARLWNAVDEAAPDNWDIRNQLNEALLPYYMWADRQDNPENYSYSDFRDGSLSGNPLEDESVPDDLIEQVQNLEDEFLLLLDSNYAENWTDQGRVVNFNLTTAIRYRESLTSAENFVEETFSGAIRQALIDEFDVSGEFFDQQIAGPGVETPVPYQLDSRTEDDPIEILLPDAGDGMVEPDPEFSVVNLEVRVNIDRIIEIIEENS